MSAAVEVWAIAGRRTVELAGERVTIGKGAENDLPIDEDETVSRLHAVFDRFPAGWCVTDLGSSNGTYVNGERIFGARRLHHGDEIRVGSTKLLFRNSADVGRTVTSAPEASPSVTVRERDVLVVLCRPLLDRDLFTEPASIREIATELVVSEAAVKQHLARLYDKFDVDATDHRRARLANAALRRGAVTMADLHEPPRV
jgi:pSer/pThr/pTyr-binding forkhead associated (FHA) protein